MSTVANVNTAMMSYSPASPAAGATGSNTALAAGSTGPNTALAASSNSTGSSLAMSSTNLSAYEANFSSQTTSFQMSEFNQDTVKLIAALIELLLGTDNEEDKKTLGLIALLALLGGSMGQSSREISFSQTSTQMSVSSMEMSQSSLMYSNSGGLVSQSSQASLGSGIDVGG
ncbi:MAG: hypothetical protein JW810_04575 [Sedimentisphaerales bacterium]|nr:hypothetical protein [Sedimentisphaerales bacterium]